MLRTCSLFNFEHVIVQIKKRMSVTKSYKPELADISDKIKSTDHRAVYDGLKNLLILKAQGEDCSSIMNEIAAMNPGRSIKMRRWRNIILGDSYTGIGSILADFQSDNYLLQSFAVKRAGSLTTAETIDVLYPIIMEAAYSDDHHLREAACFAILKIEKNDSSLIEMRKIDELLQKLLTDKVVSVAANAASVLLEINQGRSKPLFRPKKEIIDNLLNCMEKATEWCKIQILDLVSVYAPGSEEEAKNILEKLNLHLINANSSVTIGVVRSCIKMTKSIQDKEEVKTIIQKLLPPLVKLMSSSLEIQYVVLKTILLLLQGFPFLRSANITVFFCQQDEPTYIQLAKLDIMQILTNDQNVNCVINELRNYCDWYNQQLAKRSISELGRICLTFEDAADTCIECFTDLIDKCEQDFILEQCICETVNIMRRYQGKKQINDLIQMIITKTEGEVDDPTTKSALVWILGQCYNEYAANLLDSIYIESFLEETTEVQLSILTAVVKTYISKPSEYGPMLRRLIPRATLEVNDPDLRDRAYSYMKILAENSAIPQFAELIVTCIPSEKIFSQTVINMRLVESLIPNLGSIASVLGKFPAEFKSHVRDATVLPLLLDSDPKSYNVVIRGQFQVIDDDDRQLLLKISNMGIKPLPITQIEFQYNSFGFVPQSLVSSFPKIEAKQSATIFLPVTIKAAFVDDISEISNNIKITMKVNQPRAISFKSAMPLGFLLLPKVKGHFTKEVFQEEWQKVKKEDEKMTMVHASSIPSLDETKEALYKERVFFIAKKQESGYFSGRMITNDAFIAIISFSNEAECQIILRMANSKFRDLVLGLLTQVFH